MSKGQNRKQVNEHTQLVLGQLTTRASELARSIQDAKEGRLDRNGLLKLQSELTKPIKISSHLSIEIADCHPTSGKYKKALPKGYQATINAVEKAIAQMQTQGYSAPKVDTAAHIKEKEREITEAFNAKPKKGIQILKDIVTSQGGTSVPHQIAIFFHQNKKDLDLEAVGDYLSGPEVENKAALAEFTKQIPLAGQSFNDSLRTFLKTFKLPGEAQKIDRLVESFSTAYCLQNPKGFVATKEAAYILAFQMIMLNTDLHNPNIPEDGKMSLTGLVANLRGCNDGQDFDKGFLESLYHDIKATPFELNFVKKTPGYTLHSAMLRDDPTFDKLDILLKYPEMPLRVIFPQLGENIKATVFNQKSWVNLLTGYEGTLTLSNAFGKQLVTIQVYNPSIFSRVLFGDRPRVIVQPVFQDEKNKEAIALAAKVTNLFSSPITSIEATYDYLKQDLQTAYSQEKQHSSTSSATNPNRMWTTKEGEKDSDNVKNVPTTTI